MDSATPPAITPNTPVDRRRAAAILMTACSLAAFLRVAQTVATRDVFSATELLVAVRWRLWDWWFWVPVAPLVWRLVRRRSLVNFSSASTVGTHALALTGLILVHRTYSLVGMWLFVRTARFVSFSDPGFFDISAVVLIDALTYAALIGACSVIQARADRRERLVRRRHAIRDRRARAVLADQDDEATGVPSNDAATNGLVLERVVVRTGRRQYVVALAGVRWIEADGYCCRLHDGDGVHVVRLTMTQLEESLDPRAFLRVHRSAIANFGFARELRQGSDSSHSLMLSDGTLIPVSRAKYPVVRKRLAAP